MVINTIPPWDHNGVLPSIEGDDPTQGDGSPYSASPVELVERFGTSEPRRRLLAGLLDYRVELRQAGLIRGHQWINGSFAENVEANEGRPPRDIDLVTFFYIPDGETAETLLRNHPSLFDGGELRTRYSIDAYYLQLNQTTPEDIIKESTYWHSLWSHTRDRLWKGYLQVDLSDEEDEQARRLLAQMEVGSRGRT